MNSKILGSCARAPVTLAMPVNTQTVKFNHHTGSRNPKHRFLSWLLVMLTVGGAVLQCADAQPVTTIDPSSFATGTNVSNAFAGITLSAMTYVPDGTNPQGVQLFNASYAPVYADGDLFTTQRAPASTANWGIQFLGPANLCLQNCFPVTPQGSQGTDLLISFNKPVNMVTALQIDNPMNGMSIQAFNSSNQLVGYCGAFGQQPEGNYGCYSVLSPSCNGDQSNCVTSTSASASNITRVLVGGYDQPDEVGAFQFARAPEIDPSSAASGLTLLLGGLMLLRGRRATRSFSVDPADHAAG